LAELESAESCSSGQEQLAGVVLLLALAELESVQTCQEQLAGVALALAKVEAWKEEAVAVKRKACISSNVVLLDTSSLTSRNISSIGAGNEIGYLKLCQILNFWIRIRDGNLRYWCCG
jgi:hypothetical protein